MRLVLDQNLPRYWLPILREAGHDVIVWSQVGASDADDIEICRWAHAHDRIVVTQDLDFGAILKATGALGPSVVILRARDGRPAKLEREVLWTLERYTFSLQEGALVMVDHQKQRVRMLPLE
jgi:predicted nuclease of predicted toxin-antitoxin system